MGKRMIPGWMIILATAWAGQSTAQEIRIAPAMVISVVTSDWNDDGLMDRAVLYDGGAGDGALAIYFSDTYGDWRIVGFDPQNAWLGGWGQQPELLLNEAGDLQVRSMNIGSGRNRWQMDLTLAYMNKAFVVKTYEYKDHDSLDLNNSGSCTLNVFTGVGQAARGDAASLPFKVNGRIIRLGDWTYEDVPKECG